MPRVHRLSGDSKMKTLIILCAPCGVGKSTIRELLAARNQLPDFACIDTDAVGLNWHVYKGTDHENQYYTDTLKRADEISGDKNIFFVSAGMNPPNFYCRSYRRFYKVALVYSEAS